MQHIYAAFLFCFSCLFIQLHTQLLSLSRTILMTTLTTVTSTYYTLLDCAGGALRADIKLLTASSSAIGTLTSLAAAWAG